MGKKSPIGIFDSGVGGLTVVKSLLEELPGESFIYFGDTAHVPYGNKSEKQLLGYAHNIVSFLIDQEVKAIVVACGTHSSVTLSKIIDQYSVPLLGVVKAGARAAAGSTVNGNIGVAATHVTVSSRAYTRELIKINPEFEVFEKECPRLVPLVESGILDGAELREALSEYLLPLMKSSIDTLVLGCTHYPFLTSIIKEYVGNKVELIDPSYETIAELKEMLISKKLLNDSGEIPLREFYVSGNDNSFYTVGRLLLGDIIKKVDRKELD